MLSKYNQDDLVYLVLPETVGLSTENISPFSSFSPFRIEYGRIQWNATVHEEQK